MAYEGMACLKLYKNFSCTDEIELNEEGMFVYNSEPVSNNALRPITHTLYVKNVGTHKAYDVTVRVITSDITMNAALILSGVIIVPMQVVKLTLTGDFEAGSISSKTVLTVDYNNV